MARDNLAWTDLQRDILDKLKTGLTVTAITDLGYSRATVQRVNRQYLAGREPPPRKQKKEKTTSKKVVVTKPSGDGQTPPGGEEQQRPPPRYRPIEVGSLLIEPADWRINQYGAFMIMNTHAYARENFGYTGSVAEFICDACQAVRRLMGIDVVPFKYLEQEGSNDGDKQAGEGAGVLEQSGEQTYGGEDG